MIAQQKIIKTWRDVQTEKEYYNSKLFGKKPPKNMIKEQILSIKLPAEDA